MDEIIQELLRQLRSKDERIEFLTNQLLGLNPGALNSITEEQELKPIGRKRQFKAIVELADRQNQQYWKEQAVLAEKEIEEARLNASKESETIRNGTSSNTREFEGSNADSSSTRDGGEDSKEEKESIRQGIA